MSHNMFELLSVGLMRDYKIFLTTNLYNLITQKSFRNEFNCYDRNKIN